jgi:hypothetical protein
VGATGISSIGGGVRLNVLPHVNRLHHACDRPGDLYRAQDRCDGERTFRSEQGAPLSANFTVTNAMVAAQLGRNLSAPGGSVVVNLIEPGTMYGDRLNEVDFRIAKLLRFGRTRTNVGVDVYNLFNANPALTYHAAYSLALPLPRPTGVLTPRFAKISAQIDF